MVAGIIAGVFLLLSIGGIGVIAYIKSQNKKANPVEIVDNKPLTKDDSTTTPELPKPDAKTETKPDPKKSKDELAPVDLTPTEVIDLLTPSTALIVIQNEQSASMGSGVLIHRNPDLVLSNHHVVDDELFVNVFFPEPDTTGKIQTDLNHYLGVGKSKSIRGKVLARDIGRDMALIELTKCPPMILPIPLAVESAKKLESVYGVGQSGIKLETERKSLWQPYTGNVRQVEELKLRFNLPGTFNNLLLQTAINSGDSGGPIVNKNLELVAIARAVSTIQTNQALCVDITEIRKFVSAVYQKNYNAEFDHAPSLLGLGKAKKPKTTEQLIADIEKGTNAQAQVASYVLLGRGAESVPLLIELLKKQSAASRWPIVLNTLAQIGSPAHEAVQPAMACLKTDHTPTKIAAISFLKSIAPHGRVVIPELWDYLDAPDGTLRKLARTTLIEYGPYRKTDLPDFLAKASKNSAIRETVVEMMMGMNDLNNAELNQELERVGYTKATDAPTQRLMARIVREYPERFDRRQQLEYMLRMLNSTDRLAAQQAQITLEVMTWDRNQFTPLTDDEKKPFVDDANQESKLTGYSFPLDVDLLASQEINTADELPAKPILKDRFGKIYSLKRTRNIRPADQPILWELVTNQTMPVEGIVYACGLIQTLGKNARISANNWNTLLTSETGKDSRVTYAVLASILHQESVADELHELIIKQTRHSDQLIRLAAIANLVHFKAKQQELLSTYLYGFQDAEQQVRLQTYHTFLIAQERYHTKYISDQDVDQLVTTIESTKHPLARYIALMLLAKTGDKAKKGIEQLKELLRNDNANVVIWAVHTLTQFKEGAAFLAQRYSDELTDDVLTDTIKFVSDAAEIQQFQPIDFTEIPEVSMSTRSRATIEQIYIDLETKENLKGPEATKLYNKSLLRRALIRAISQSDAVTTDLVPLMQKILRKSKNLEVLYMTLLALQKLGPASIDKDPNIIDDCVRLYGLSYETEEYLLKDKDSEFVALNKRRVVFRKILTDTIKTMRAPALPLLVAGLRKTYDAQRSVTDRFETYARLEGIKLILEIADEKFKPEVLSKILGVMQTAKTFLEADLNTINKQYALAIQQTGGSTQARAELNQQLMTKSQLYKDGQVIVRQVQALARELEKKK